jgi:hypothetical protein
MLAQHIASLSSAIELKLVDIAQDESNTEKEQARHRAMLEEEREELAKERKENERQRVERERERERDKARMEKFRKREAELDKREKDEKLQAELRAAVFTRTLRNGTHEAASRAPLGGGDTPKHVSFRPILRSRTYTAGCCGLADTKEVLSCPSKLEQQKGLDPRDTSSQVDEAGKDVAQDERGALGIEMLPGILSLSLARCLTPSLLLPLLLFPSLSTRHERAPGVDRYLMISGILLVLSQLVCLLMRRRV